MKPEIFDEHLSAHFTLGEMLKSGIAIRMGIDNNIRRDEELHLTGRRIRQNLTDLCEQVLEPLRMRVGRVIVTSGYRCKELNEMVSGVPNSQHRYGEAVDIYVADKDICRKYARIIMTHATFDQMILEPQKSKQKRWLHVSYTRRFENRREVIGDIM